MLTVVRSLANAEAVAQWARSEGFADIVPRNWHVTLARTYEAVDLSMLRPDPTMLIVEASEDRVITRMGGIIALLFGSVALAARHREFRDAGADWAHPNFRPHVTIAVDDRRDLGGIVAFADDLVFGGEIWSLPGLG